MSHKFSIDFDWLSRESGCDVERATLAEIKISIENWTATELEDLFSKTVRSTARVSAYSLAMWFASNWWRLRWEPKRKNLSWDMSHKVGAAGDGYLWPDLSFDSDGESVLVHSKSLSPVPGQSIRYLNNFDISIPVSDFEQEIDNFVDVVISRLTSEGAVSAGLIELWAEVLQERRDPIQTTWRKLEAILGFDPGEAQESLVESLQKLANDYGINAVEEIAANSTENSVVDIETLWRDSRQAASKIIIPKVESLRGQLQKERTISIYPWQKAEKAAHIARETWSLETGPITTKNLCEILSLSPRAIEKPKNVEGSINAGFRNEAIDTIGVYLRPQHYPENARFALLRLVGDHLTASEEDRLLPATNIGTQRQKFQRTFAQEFLCPYSELINYLGSEDLSNESIEDAANYFEVSPLMVRTILVNKGHLERSSI